METVTGVVERTNFKMMPTKFGEKPHKSFLVNGEWFGGFITDDNKREMEAANDGDVVKLTLQTSGKYKNLTNISLVSKNEKVDTKQPTSITVDVSKSVQTLNDKDRRITYLASRRDAIEFVKFLIGTESVPLPAKKAEKADAIHEYVKHYSNKFVDDAYGIVDSNKPASKQMEISNGE